MTKDKFTEQFRMQLHTLWSIGRCYEADPLDLDTLKWMMADIKEIVVNMQELADVYEMENKVK